jgi:CBS-domain-containing membrane protein
MDVAIDKIQSNPGHAPQGEIWDDCRHLLARDIMQARLHGAAVSHSVIDTVRLMHKYHLLQCPVLIGNEPRERTIIGVVRAKDIFNEIVTGACALERAYYDWQALDFPVSRLMRHKLRCVGPHDDLERVISVMSAEQLDSLLVTDGTCGLGYLSSTDVLTVLIRLGSMFQLILGEDLQEMRSAFSLSLLNFVKLLQAGSFSVSRIMTKPSVFLEEHDDVMKAMSLLASGYWRYVPVMTEEGKFAGILSDSDMLGFLASIRMGDEIEEVIFSGRLSRSALRDKTVGELIRPGIQTVAAEMPLWEACEYLVSNDHKCLAVHEKQSGFCGLLSQSELIRGFGLLIQMYPNVLNLLGA